MRVGRFALFLLLFLPLSPGLKAQQLGPTVQRDPQAIAVLSQALAAAGGTPTISSVQDVTATGTVAFSWAGQDVNGTVTAKGRGTTQFRLEATLPDGLRSWVISHGQRFKKDVDSKVTIAPYRDPSSFQNILFPLADLLAALQDSSISLSYAGIEARNGSQVHHIAIAKPVSPPVDQATHCDFFIDTSTMQIVSVVGVAFSTDSHAMRPREVQYSDYRAVNGVMVPFSITELISDQRTFAIQLNQLSTNTGLSDSDFQP